MVFPRVTIAYALVLLGAAGCARDAVRHPADQLGWVDRSALTDPRYPAFQVVYDTSRIAPEFTDMIREVQKGVDVLVFFGAWCSDSQRELPRFLKIADLAGIPEKRVRLYSLDRSKKSPDGLTATYGIERVPTFIFLKGGNEVGRIVEIPRTTLEADVLTILVSAQAP